jgi:hypothetical protein
MLCPFIHYQSGAKLSDDFVVYYTVWNILVFLAAFVFGYKRHSAIKAHWGYYVEDALSASMDRRKATLARRRAGKGATEDSDQDKTSFTDDANESMPYMARTDKDGIFSTLGSVLVLVLMLLPLTIFILVTSSSVDKQASGQTAPSGADSARTIQPIPDAAQSNTAPLVGSARSVLPTSDTAQSNTSTQAEPGNDTQASTATTQTSTATPTETTPSESCDNGNGTACLAQGNAYLSRQDVQHAGSYFEKACDKGVVEGCYRAGQLYSEQGDYLSMGDRNISLLLKGCNGGLSDSCGLLNTYLIYSASPKVRAMFGRACNEVSNQGWCASHQDILTAAHSGQPATAISPANQPYDRAPELSTWTDSATGLMWTKDDNGIPVDWQGAVGHCQNLRLGGYRDWRLPEIGELIGMYDAHENVSGRRGDGSLVAFHVKGNLVLSGFEWSNTKRKLLGGAFVIAFHAGIKEVAPLDTIGDGRALCVRHQ